MSLSPDSTLRHVRFGGAPALPHGHRHRAEGPPSAARVTPATGQEHPPSALAIFLLSRAGLDPQAYCPLPLRRRLPACLRALGAATEDEAVRRIESDPAALSTAVSRLLIGVTGFFRDAAVFDAIRARVVPALAAQPTAVRVWSVGCSSGAELYSTALVLAEGSALHRADLLGTDCRPDAIESAREGLFDGAAAEAIPPELRRAYCERHADGRHRIIATIRQRIAWKVADATRDAEPGPWDLVLWRNVAIYLQPQTATAIATRLVAALRPGGFLVVGRAERPLAALGLQRIDACIYRKPSREHR
jgi:chemotaxis methyl-accepting protein methylase